MQEEVENRTVNLAISMTKFSLRQVLNGLGKFLRWRGGKKQMKKQRKYQIKTDKKIQENRRQEQRKAEGPHGKQTVKQLAAHSKDGVKSLPVADRNVRQLRRICRDYGVDFAIRKCVKDNHDQYYVFFKARDTDTLAKVYAELAKNLRKKRSKAVEKRPSVLKELNELKTAQKPVQKSRQKQRTREAVR